MRPMAAELFACAESLGPDGGTAVGRAGGEGGGRGGSLGHSDDDGIVGDLGGGAWSWCAVRGGRVEDRVSFPLGVLRIPALRERGGKTFERHIARMIDDAGWEGRGRGLPFYMVGGSWRALARLDMTLAGYPLPIIHHYELTPSTILRLSRTIPHLSKARFAMVPGAFVQPRRDVGRRDGVARRAAQAHMGQQHDVVSAFGSARRADLRRLDARTRALDPLIVRRVKRGGCWGGFRSMDDLLDGWIAPLFEGRGRWRCAAGVTPPGLLAMSDGAPIQSFAPNAGWRSRCMAIGWARCDRSGDAGPGPAHQPLAVGSTCRHRSPTRHPRAIEAGDELGPGDPLGQRLAAVSRGPLERTALAPERKEPRSGRWRDRSGLLRRGGRTPVTALSRCARAHARTDQPQAKGGDPAARRRSPR